MAQARINVGADALRGDLELALFAGKIAAYAQGFAVMDGASKEFGWGLPLATIARIWRAGCIIRSQFLGTIAAAFGGSATAPNLLMVPAFTDMMKEAHPALRRVVARAVEAGLPMPALSSALAYFDATARAAAPRTSSRRSAISSARTVSSGSMPTAPITVPGAAALPDPASTVAQAARQASGAAPVLLVVRARPPCPAR